MSTGIQWTDETWNPVVGCTQVSPGCAHCYAKQLHDMRHRAHLAGKAMVPQYAVPFEVVQLKPERLTAPLSWRKGRRVFVNSVADLFHDDVPDEFIAEVFAIMALAERHTFQVLTKRPARMQALLSAETFLDTVLDAAEKFWSGVHPDADDDISAWFPWMIEENWPLNNVWLGVSVENQRFADERIPLLAETPAAVRFLSCEPLLGPVNLDLDDIAHRSWDGRCLDWVIVGGESGKGARSLDIRWVADIVAQCKAADVATFVKQLGARPVVANDSGADAWPGGVLPLADGYEPRHQGEIAPLKLRDRHGADMAEWPEDLRIREFPASEVRA